jgi:hypothetical protein
VLYYSVAVAAGSGAPPDQIAFIQDGQRYEVENGAGLLALDGAWPGTSVGVVRLPKSFDAHAPIWVSWGGAEAEFRFAW